MSWPWKKTASLLASGGQISFSSSPACSDPTFRMVGFNLSDRYRPLRAQLIARHAEVGAGYVHSLEHVVVDFHKIVIVKTVTVIVWGKFGDGSASGRAFCPSGSCFSAASGRSLCARGLPLRSGGRSPCPCGCPACSWWASDSRRKRSAIGKRSSSCGGGRTFPTGA